MLANPFKSKRQIFWDEIQAWRDEQIELPRFFWRDDDLSNWVPNVDLCLRLAEARGIGVAFAAIPTRLTQRAAEAVRNSSHGRLAIHGYGHENHVVEGDSSEFPRGRADDAVLAELRAGMSLIRGKGRSRYLNMFVPPWGRFDQQFDRLLTRAGFVSFSGNAKSKRFSVALQWDCQVTTEHNRAPLDSEAILARVAQQLERRRRGKIFRHQPLGLMTHHRTLDTAMATTLEELLDNVLEAGFHFSDFKEIDAVAEQQAAPSVSVPTAIAAASAPTDAARIESIVAAQLSAPTLPRDDEGYPGLARLLTLLAGLSPVALLRFAHMQDLAARLPNAARVLSVGCGKAITEVALAMLHPDQHWVAFDVDATRYASMQTYAAEQDVSNISFLTLDIESASTPEAGLETLGSFDAAVMVEVLMYLKDPGSILARLGRTLRPGGIIAGIEPFVADASDTAAVEALCKHTQSLHGGFTHDALRSMIAEAGCLELERLYNCYQAKPHGLVSTIWPQLAKSNDPTLIDLAFALARLDLGGELTSSRREATAVAFSARAK